MEWHASWTTAAIFIGIALLLIILVLAAKNNRGGRRYIGRDNEKGMETRHRDSFDRGNSTLVYRDRRSAEDQRGGMQIARKQPSVQNAYDKNEAMKIFGRPQSNRTFKENMTSKDPLKVIFGSPDRTFDEQMRDTSSLKMIFGVKKDNVESKVESKEGE